MAISARRDGETINNATMPANMRLDLFNSMSGALLFDALLFDALLFDALLFDALLFDALLLGTLKTSLAAALAGVLGDGLAIPCVLGSGSSGI